MKIKSPLVDYYDHVGNAYGGGDPKIVYVRNRVFPPNPAAPHLNLSTDVCFPHLFPKLLAAIRLRRSRAIEPKKV